jgi:hypothetical protein
MIASSARSSSRSGRLLARRSPGCPQQRGGLAEFLGLVVTSPMGTFVAPEGQRP